MASISATSLIFKSSVNLSSSTSQASYRISSLRTISVGWIKRSSPSLRTTTGFRISCAAQPKTLEKVVEIVKKQLALPAETELKTCAHPPITKRRFKSTVNRVRFVEKGNDDPFFSQERKNERIALFANRKLESCKYLDLEWFQNNGFIFPEIILQQSLETFCTLSSKVYPRCVREFYANLVKKNDEWVTEVKGIRIRVNHGTFLQVGGLENVGLKFDEMMESNWVGFNITSTFISCVHPKKNYYGRKMKVGLMSVNHRLLHYMIVYLLLPRLHNRAQTSEEDLKVIYAFKYKIQINWADFILMHMIRRHKNPSGALPYPVLISKIIEFAGVDVSNEDKLPMREHGDEIGKATIHKMQIGKFDGMWQWIEDMGPGRQQDPEEGKKEASDQEATAFGNTSSSDSWKNAHKLLEEQFTLLKSELDEKDRSIKLLEERLNYGITLLESLLGNKEKDSFLQSSSSES